MVLNVGKIVEHALMVDSGWMRRDENLVTIVVIKLTIWSGYRGLSAAFDTLYNTV